MNTKQNNGEPVTVENIMNPDNRKVRSEISHAFDDAIINASMEDTEQDAYRTYRRMLDMHFEIYLDEYCDDEDDADLFWSIVDQVAASMNQTDTYRKAMEVF